MRITAIGAGLAAFFLGQLIAGLLVVSVGSTSTGDPFGNAVWLVVHGATYLAPFLCGMVASYLSADRSLLAGLLATGLGCGIMVILFQHSTGEDQGTLLWVVASYLLAGWLGAICGPLLRRRRA
jgi:hypothetical protein